MPQDTTTTSVWTHGSIRWSEDDVCARAMERPEYFGCVRGIGPGPLPVRSSCRSSWSSAPPSQDPRLLQIGVLMAQVGAHQERILAQEQ